MLIQFNLICYKQTQYQVLTAPDKRGHGPLSNASRAASTAKSMSSLIPSATLVITSPVLGSIVSNVLPTNKI